MFGERFHGPLVHEAVRAELAAQPPRHRVDPDARRGLDDRRQGLAPEGHRPRARRRALRRRTARAAAWPSGPKPRGYTVKVNRKARRRALRAALSVHAERGSIAALDPSKFDTPSTKAAAEALAGFDGDGSVLIVLDRRRGELP